jgi:hypothetical protein
MGEIGVPADIGALCHTGRVGVVLGFQNCHQLLDVAEDGALDRDIDAGLAWTPPAINPAASKLNAIEMAGFFATTISSLTRVERQHPCRSRVP